MSNVYVHGYEPRENVRLRDQAATLVELLHADTFYPAGSRVLEAGCGVGAQTLTLRAAYRRNVTILVHRTADVVEPGGYGYMIGNLDTAR